MLKRLSIIDMHQAVQSLIKRYTNLKSVDGIKIDEESPFTFIEIFEKVPMNTKTMFIDKYTIHIHVVSAMEKNDSSVNHYGNINQIEEAMTKRMILQPPFDIFRQEDNGMITNYMDETGERNAVLSYSFWISYGFKVKI